MTIPELFSKFKAMVGRVPEGVLLVCIVVLVGIASFGLGRISALEANREPVQVRMGDGSVVSSNTTSKNETRVESQKASQSASAGASFNDGEVVGSKNSNKYHLPWCSGAQRISEANKITFKSVAEAEAAGYVPAANCPGL
jgi:hypothetical protein